MDSGAICKLIQEHLAPKLGVQPDAVHPSERFRRLGVDSLAATTMLAAIGAALGRSLSPTLAWRFPTPMELARHLAGEETVSPVATTMRRRSAGDDAVAIVGLSCRLPSAPNPSAFWRLLCNGVDAIREVPPTRWDLDAFYDGDTSSPGKMSTRFGGFLDDVGDFDASFFGISPREAIEIDPQQRLMLELSWEALEDAGVAPAALKDTSAGVFFGAMWTDYMRLAGATDDRIALHTATGQDLSIIPARVSYTLGLLGPSLHVNTACSSSLVAVHLARQSLLRGESNLALAGGVNLILAPQSTIAMSKFGAMAPDGRSKAFDARANGYVRGEGGGVVILKRLSDAMADGDRVYCVIRGSAVNNDGFSNGLTAPSPRAQEAVVRDACLDAGVVHHEVQYVEAHGTGTMLGDPIEAGALGAVLGPGRDPRRPLRIGSVKTNIGHLEPAAGVAGLIKVALSMAHRELPSSLHFQKPNPHIPFDELKIRVQATREPWEAEAGKRIAGVSSFGFGGTNAHLVLESADAARSVRLAAASEAELAKEARRLRDALRASPSALDAIRPPAGGAYRLAVTVSSARELAEQLENHLDGHPLPGLVAGVASSPPPRVVLVFGGQGSQWAGMGRALLRDEPAARAVLERCDAAIHGFLGWSLLERLRRDDPELLDRTDVVQPALFAMQVALAEALRARGLRFDAVVGQSMGEIGAAHVAGALSLTDAVRIMCVRSQLVGKAERGRMLVVGLSLAATREAIAPFGERLSVAVAAGPESNVVAGAEDAVTTLHAQLESRGVAARVVRVDYASHSHYMDPLLPELERQLAPVRPRRGDVAFWSTVTGELLEGTALDAAYWARNLRQPVLFAPTVERLAQQGPTVFVEVDPHPVLALFVEQCMAKVQGHGAVVGCAARDEAEPLTLREAAGRLFVAGCAIEADPGAVGAPARSAELVVLSARTPEALRESAARLREHLAAPEGAGGADAADPASLGDVAYSAIATRSPMEHRLAITVASREQLLRVLDAAARGESPAEAMRGQVPPRAGRLAWLFTGQGAQALGMGRFLHAEWPVFREALEDACAALDPRLERPLRDVMWAAPGSADASLLDRTAFTQPALFAVEWALAALWRSWGIEPDLLAGHSIGEITAACVAGVFSLPDAARLVAERGRLMQALPDGGAMVAIEAPEAQVAAAVAPHAATVAVAAVNGPSSVVIAGAEGPVQQIAEQFAARQVRTKRLVVSHAFHSPLMGPMLESFREVARSIAYSAPAIPLVSNVSGKQAGAEMATADYWVRHVREAVRFEDGVKALQAAGVTTFVEIGPRTTLLDLAARSLSHDAVLVPSLRRPGRSETESMFEGLGALFVRGATLDAKRLFPHGARRVPLPAYPWQRERYWREGADSAQAPRKHAGGHPLLGPATTLSTQGGTWVWETALDVGRLSWLGDHRVQGAIVFPGSGYVEMLLAAAAEALPDAAVEVANLEILQVLALPEKGSVVVQVVMSEQGSGAWTVRVASRASEAASKPWTLHARGLVRRTEAAKAENGTNGKGTAHADLASLRRALDEATPATLAADLYAAFARAGLAYGPAFQGVSHAGRRDGEALGRIALAEKAGPAAAYRVHPALLDACFQVAEVALAADGSATWLPVKVGAFRLHGPASAVAWCHARVAPTAAGDGRERSVDLTLFDHAGAVVAEVTGLAMREAASEKAASRDDDLVVIDWQASPTPAPAIARGKWLIVGDGAGLGSALAASLEAAGHAVVHAVAAMASEPPGNQPRAVHDTTVDGVRALLGAAFAGAAPTAIVHLRSLDGGGEADPIEAATVRSCDSLLCVIQGVAAMGWRDTPRLWVVTRGAQAGGARNVEQSLAIGLGRTTAMEYPDLRCSRVDLDPAAGAREVEDLRDQLLGDDGEDEVAWRAGTRLAARLARAGAAPERVERVVPAKGRPYRLAIDEPGILDRLALRAAERRAPGRGEVEVEVEAAGINFLDVLLALGVMPDDAPGSTVGAGVSAFGLECAGRVVAVGEGVLGLAAGDPVIAIGRGALASHLTTPAALVARWPAGLSASQAASLPIAHLTAWYALDKVARLQKGERVLIHAATGGVGMAAVQWARHVGAEVYATAGTPEKRALLAEIGVRFVSDSRSDRFVADVMEWTNGEGVDVVLNSLAGDLIEKSFGLLRAYGRFVEIGKRDYYANSSLGLRPFLKNLSFSLVDLRGMIVERPSLVGALLGELVEHFAAGVFAPPTVEAFPIARANEAFRKMAQARHVSKLALTLDDPEVPIRVSAAPGARIRKDASYVVTGGLGGLGLSLAGWLAERGAGHVVLAGRSGATTEAQRQAVARIEKLGAAVTVAEVDVADRASLAALLAGLPAGRPLRGVFHAAGLVDDGLLAGQTPARFRRVIAPKAAGAWNLHALTRDADLDHFVLYGSVVGLLGSPGQGNYAAANTFLDALAHHRRELGLPALSIDWAPFADVGLAAASENRGQRMEGRGLRSWKPEEGLALLERAMARGEPHLGVLSLDVRQWLEFFPVAGAYRLLARLLEEQQSAARPAGDSAVRTLLDAAKPEARPKILEGIARDQVALVLRIPSEKIGRDVPFASLGMDSLMGLELRNRLEAVLGVRLPTGALWTYPTLAALSAHLAGGEAAHAEAVPNEPPPPANDALKQEVAGMASGDLLSFMDDLLAQANRDAT